jgi:hypothetical protein
MSPWILSLPDMKAICALSLPLTRLTRSPSDMATVQRGVAGAPAVTAPPGAVPSTLQVPPPGPEMSNR